MWGARRRVGLASAVGTNMMEGIWRTKAARTALPVELDQVSSYASEAHCAARVAVRRRRESCGAGGMPSVHPFTAPFTTIGLITEFLAGMHSNGPCYQPASPPQACLFRPRRARTWLPSPPLPIARAAAARESMLLPLVC